LQRNDDAWEKYDKKLENYRKTEKKTEKKRTKSDLFETVFNIYRKNQKKTH